MEIKGLWKISEAEMFIMDDEGFRNEWRTAEDILSDESLEEDYYIKEMLPAQFLIDENEIKIILPLSQKYSKEEIAEAVAAGEIELFDGDKTVVEKYSLKEENGKLYYDSGEKGEVFGEPVSPWKEIPFTGSGIQFTSYRLVRIK